LPTLHHHRSPRAPASLRSMLPSGRSAKST
jgi:hypothetical protein